MDSIKLLEELFDKKTITLLRLFLNNEDKEYYIRELARTTRTPLATSYRILQKLQDLKIIKSTKIKHLKTYQLLRNEHTKYLTTLFEEKKSILQVFIDKISTVEGIFTVMLHGQEEKDKANVVIIGQSIDETQVRAIVVDIKKSYNFNIAHLVLEQAQFTQMAAMGLFPGKKITLFEKHIS